jgi:autotransporter-associated beta strand protein
LLVRNAGVLSTPAITLGVAAQSGGIDEFQALGGTTNIGSGGIVEGAGVSGPSIVVALGSASVSTAPTIAASASWSSSLPMTLTNGGASVAPTFQTGNDANITLSGVLDGSGGLTKTGAGTLILSVANGYSGGTIVYGGTLELGTANALTTTGALTVSGSGANAGTLDLAGNNQTVGVLSDGGVSTGTITTSTGTPTLTVANGTYSGAITGNLAVTENGNSTLTLSGSNSFTGGTTLGGGNLIVSNNYGLGAPASLSANAGLTFNNTTASNVYFTSANPQVASINNGGSNTGADKVILGNASGAGSPTTLMFGAGGTAQTGDIFTGTIGDLSGTVATAVGNIEIVNGAFVELMDVDTFTGTTIIAGTGPLGASMLELGNPGALENSTLNYNDQGGFISFGSLTSGTLGGLSGRQSLAIGQIALTIGNNNVSSLYTGSLTGGASILKTGTGTVQFGNTANGGAADYTGSTTVVSGTLIVGGASDLKGSVDLTGAAAAPGGTGAPNGLIVQDNAIINTSSELFLSSDDDGGDGGAGYAGPSTLSLTSTATVTAPSLSIGNTSRVTSGASVTVSGHGSLIVKGNFTLLNTEGATCQHHLDQSQWRHPDGG